MGPVNELCDAKEKWNKTKVFRFALNRTSTASPMLAGYKTLTTVDTNSTLDTNFIRGAKPHRLWLTKQDGPEAKTCHRLSRYIVSSHHHLNTEGRFGNGEPRPKPEPTPTLPHVMSRPLTFEVPERSVKRRSPIETASAFDRRASRQSTLPTEAMIRASRRHGGSREWASGCNDRHYVRVR